MRTSRHTTVRRAAALAAFACLAACTGGSSAVPVTPATHDRFPITDGSPHEKIECNTCHGQFDTFERFNCHTSGCHAEVETAPKHVKAAGYEYLSESCYLCHPRGVKGTGVDHTSFFPIAKGQAHESTSCSVCHTRAADPRAVTCADGSCHGEAATNATHPDVLGYDWGKSTCLTCHPNAKVGSVDHSALFPIERGQTHGAVACATCHENRDDYRQVTCTGSGCHARGATDDTHGAVSGYEYADKSCVGCHPNGLPGLADHGKFFPIASGEAHGDQQCSSCHRSPDRKQVTCASGDCHARGATDDTHGAVLGYEYLSPSCLACHPSAATGQHDHAKFFPIASGTKHAGVVCESCHRDPVNRKPVTCLGGGCHAQPENDAKHQGFPSYAYASGQCLNCHLGGAKQIDHSYFPIAAGTKHENLPCAQCHAVPGDRHALNCASSPCHAPAATGAQHGEAGGFQWQSQLCARCHPNGLVPRVAEHLPWGITPGYPHNKKGCLTCHPSVQIGRPAYADFTIRYCFNAGCHIQAAVTALHLVVAPGKFKPDSVSCLMSGCHQNGRKP